MKVTYADGFAEEVISRDDYSLGQAVNFLDGKTIAVLGYGRQGSGQAQNLRDTIAQVGGNVNVILGQRQTRPDGEESASYTQALEDGWVPRETLFDLETATGMGDVVCYLLPDAEQVEHWAKVRDNLQGNSTLLFSHGFGPGFPDQTGIITPSDVNEVLFAPKGAGWTVRRNFVKGSGISASYAVGQDATGDARDIVLSYGRLAGAAYLFETTIRKEVTSDLFGERFVLLGGIWGLAEAFYDFLRQGGVGEDEAFLFSSETLTQGYLPMIGEIGIEGVYEYARQDGTLSIVLQAQQFVRDGLTDLIEGLYSNVVSGGEVARVLSANGVSNYQDALQTELNTIDSAEMWQVAKRARSMRGADDRITEPNSPILLGALLGMIELQARVLIEHGHSPSEAFNETVEELTQSLNLIYQDTGIAGLVGKCSTTAQRGTLDWGPKIKEYTLRLLGENYALIDTDYVPKPLEQELTLTMKTLIDAGQRLRNLRPERL